MGGLLREPAFWVVALVVLLLFGAKRLPDTARGLGRSLRIFKAETEGLRGSSGDEELEVPPAATARYLVDPATGEKVLAQPLSAPHLRSPES